MFNDTCNTSTSATARISPAQSFKSLRVDSEWGIGSSQAWWVFAAACFLVSVPVFFQAPLVRLFPWLSLALTGGWVWLGLALLKRPSTQVWGDLLLGFSWSWLAGSIYWGWLRWEPSIHLPVEAIGLPFALWCLARRSPPAPLKKGGEGHLKKAGEGQQVGNLFYLGSLFGTAVTDLYFYLVGLIDYWRELMQVSPALATPILQNAIAQVRTPWGTTWAVILVCLLLAVGIGSLFTRQIHWWAFGGAVLSTIFVDSLFWVVASMA